MVLYIHLYCSIQVCTIRSKTTMLRETNARLPDALFTCPLPPPRLHVKCSIHRPADGRLRSQAMYTWEQHIDPTSLYLPPTSTSYLPSTRRRLGPADLPNMPISTPGVYAGSQTICFSCPVVPHSFYVCGIPSFIFGRQILFSRTACSKQRLPSPFCGTGVT